MHRKETSDKNLVNSQQSSSSGLAEASSKRRGSNVSLSKQLHEMVMEAKESRAAAKRSKEIDEYLKKEAAKSDPSKRVIILLLGPGDSGKSTVLRQMMLLHGDGFSEDMRREFKESIQDNIIKNTTLIIQRLKACGDVTEDMKIVLQNNIPRSELGTVISRVYNDVTFKQELQTGYQITGFDDNAALFISKAKQYFKPDYKLTDTDLITSRRKTEAISETQFAIQGQYWTIVDVGGQIHHRERWKVYFEKELSSIIYVVSAPSYCQVLEESPDSNRMADAIELFQILLDMPGLVIPSMIVFVNKVDLLEERMKKYPVNDYIPAYQDENDKSAYLKWLWKLFKDKAAKANVPLYIYSTTATDTNLMKKVTVSVSETIVKKAMKSLWIE